MTKSDTLVIAKITGAHGIHGAVIAKAFTTEPLGIAKYKNIFDKNQKKYEIKNIRLQKHDFVIIKFIDCNDRNMAETLKGTELIINQSELEATGDEEFYYSDLIGSRAFDQEGKEWGIVKNVANFGAGDILDIVSNEYSFMIPFTKDAVPELHLNEHKIIINNVYIVLPNKDGEDNVEG